ncbi:2-oxoglutarate dehydrogenase complex dihydrolipoyllysine-residue succinyltransferase [Alicyclobacillus tolerans]|uniref:2-oxoglutarate dehydrogenase complex dihydrolipoyllysine-residue succinyltransferase n=1 Tax=Alicyclobacillus tolerans TaxID=90970 RepID=UPI001F0012FC|nr:2-oxoglutarate dehydrogenase complex dihydrolipoyllysine-residue succinyltransferase [Alicyclobacillus tolerans]MCF8564933.1 2-oxoglutarate dehydrogenase complex dihydrolipoyllysine-residue succinyltransferase [Alicyclobacillus tolerans]
MGDIRVPELGESIVEATVGNWLKNIGDPVEAGEAVVELETDKVNVEVISEEGGTLQTILKQSGETVAVGEVLGSVGAAGAAASAGAAGAGTGSSTAAASAPVSGATAAPAAQTPAGSEVNQAGGLRAAPAVRRAAMEHGVDLGAVQGSGENGRILREDVVRAAAAPAGQPAAAAPAMASKRAAAPAAASTATASTAAAGIPGLAPASTNRVDERVRMSRRRITIARRLVEAQHTAAMLTTFNEVDMTAILDVRKRRKENFKERHGVGLGFMSFFTKAVVGALKSFPRLNAEIQGDDMILKHYYDIGVAVSTDAGLVVPVVRDADRLSFAEIEQQIASLAKRARDNKLELSELSGGTFTITNGGVFGSLLSTPILNAPQVGILGMHKIDERPVAVNGQVEIRPMMYLALSYDHRIVDGSEAVRFLVKVKELLEDPESLLLEG